MDQWTSEQMNQLHVQLDPLEARLFGVLVEKALTTPDQYPLSINAALNGANQKSNRDPILSLEEHEVAAALVGLERKYMARKVFPGNSRVEKYVHNGKDALNLDRAALAVVAELLLRGPQTAGELRARAGRMTQLESLEAVLAVLSSLTERGYARRLEPAPGSRAERYVQLLCPDLHPIEAPRGAYEARDDAQARPDVLARIEALEAKVARLEEELRALREPEPRP
jgi:uncharacterized protein YceH (UPF0502 family)